MPKGENIFVVYPECETDDAPAYKFRMDLRVVNRSKNSEEMILQVDWDEPQYMHLRKGVYLNTIADGDKWGYINGSHLAGTNIAEHTITVKPGTTEVSSQPRYSFTHMNSLWDLCQKKAFVTVEEIRNTHQGYPLYSFNFMKNTQKRRATLLAIGRIHPYETAGSYCLDGAVRTMLTNEEYREQILKRFDVVFIPIIAPAGVMRGFCRLNGCSGLGIDLAREWEDSDPVCETIRRVASERPIAGYLEIHNWMHSKIDGLKYLNLFKMNRFIGIMHKLHAPIKMWKKCLHYKILSEKLAGVKRWLRENTGAECMMVEYPWHGRTTEDMSLLGAKTIEAFVEFLKD